MSRSSSAGPNRSGHRSSPICSRGSDHPIEVARLLPSYSAGKHRLWHILIAEDNQADVALVKRALKKSSIEANLHVADDGEKVIRFFEQIDADPTSPCPDLLLLDINMPRYKGGDILRKLRTSSRCKHIPVLVVTSSDSSRDRAEMDALGANGYFRKMPLRFGRPTLKGRSTCRHFRTADLLRRTLLLSN